MKRAIRDRDLPVVVETMSEDRLPQLLDEKAAAAYIGVSPSFLRAGRAGEQRLKGRTPSPKFVRIGGGRKVRNGTGLRETGRVYYRLKDLNEWIDSLSPQEVIS